MVTRPAPARVLSASRTGVLETPSTAARSVSTSGRPDLSSPTRIACLIASSTATVRDGSAPAAPVRNADLGEGSGIMYRISYMIGSDLTPRRRGVSTPGPWPGKMSVVDDLMSGMETFTLVPRGPFTLASSIRFLEGFTPAGYSGPQDAALELAFPVE